MRACCHSRRLIPFALVACSASSALAQDAPPEEPRDPRDERWRVDPYTGGDPDRMARLGYVSYGPFYCAGDHGTAHVEYLLGHVRIRWVETAHFRLGCGLGARYLPDESRDRRVLYREVARLKQKLPSIELDGNLIDPWLATHLYAQRLEDLYADLCTRLAVTDDSFGQPRKAAEAGAGEQTETEGARRGIGEGPFLGRRNKFVVLLFEKQSDLARYWRRFCDKVDELPGMHYFESSDNLVFATAAEAYQGTLFSEETMHGHVVSNVVQMLLEGYKVHNDCIPLWWRQGVAHWYRRRVNERQNDFTGLDPSRAHRFEEWDWKPKVRGRVANEVDPKAQDLFTCYDLGDLELSDHAVIWSRVEFLMTLGDEAFARFLDHCKDRPMRSRMMPQNLVVDWHREAFRRAFGVELDDLEHRWRQHVLRTYPVK